MTAKLFSIKKPAYISTQKLGECEFIVFEKGKFSGEIDKQNLIPHGYGKLIYDNGDEFRGIFYLGKKTGRGEFFLKMETPTSVILRTICLMGMGVSSMQMVDISKENSLGENAMERVNFAIAKELQKKGSGKITTSWPS